MKAIIADTLRGTIVLTSIRSSAFEAGDEFELSIDQYHQLDIQKAIRNNNISIVGKFPKAKQKITVTNIGNSSIILPDSGVLRSKKSREISTGLLQHQEIVRLLKNGKIIKEDQDSEIADSDPTQENVSIVPYKPKGVAIKSTPKDLRNVDVKPKQIKAKKKDNGKKVKRKHVESEDDNLIIDPDSDVDNTERDDLFFVDVEQTKARLAQHPNLRKK